MNCFFIHILFCEGTLKLWFWKTLLKWSFIIIIINIITKEYSQLLRAAVKTPLLNGWQIHMEAGGAPACINKLTSQASFLMEFNGVNFSQ